MQPVPIQLRPRSYDAIIRLLEKGVEIPNPLTVDIGPEVDVDRISSRGVTLYPGCRIYGAKTAISAGVRLGAEAPVTIDDCRLGPEVELNGGSFKKSVFLERANMGPAAQVREACLLEEEANGAHCVGLKQTILFPFVTLGSLINLCDCLMAGGTSRKDHSEVGSSYIHFNFTPDGDKTTPSLFGDVPRGVMLNQPPIFLGGQGGAVGPLRLGFGTVVAAGSILRRDVLADGRFVIGASHPGVEREHARHTYLGLSRVVANNIVYLANLVALEEWYAHVRRPFFAAQELGDLIYEGALEMLALAKRERAKRLTAMASKVQPSDEGRRALREHSTAVGALFEEKPPAAGRQAFLAAFRQAVGGAAPAAGSGEAAIVPCGYTQTIQQLPGDVVAAGISWLQQVVDSLCARASELLQPLRLFHER
ncbi:MAG: UDP-N-acetylglucosamine pyrophosphorylase [Actinobacteria bacterium]|nr:UDP-N-acetylglucosamine pyrophosphorylase [Actinomycetota bacterium]